MESRKQNTPLCPPGFISFYRNPPETLYLGDDALNTKPVGHPLSLLLGGAAVSSQQFLLLAGGRLRLHLVAGIRGAKISIT